MLCSYYDVFFVNNQQLFLTIYSYLIKISS
uniref:Uncharacterized protein n=1 Tax=Siphoviridae sp. ct3gT1 TaxID=2825323 RepID=A0A8S5UJG8_9CAUD|nr:MAG TPA: hypothetical protein [Siphoviridae sp. ct3gT1]